jgi:putative ATP-dependent endonuclease of the OLD family
MSIVRWALVRLAKVNVSNYRCLGDVPLDVADLTILLGPNSAGKSTLLHALDFFFNGNELDPADVYRGQDATVSVECVFDGLTEGDRAALGPYAHGDQLVLRRTWRQGGEQKLTGRGRRFAQFDDVRAKSGRERTSTYKTLRQARPELNLPDAKTIEAVDQAMLTFEQTHPDQCAVVEDTDASQLFGYKSVGKARLTDRFRFVFVPAISDVPGEMVEKRGSLLSQLLTAVAEQRAAANEELKTIELDAREKYEAAIEDTHRPVLEELALRLSDQMRRYVPSAEILLEPSAAGFSIEPPRVDLKGGDEEERTDLGRQGHGFQRAFVISVLEYLAEAQETSEHQDDRPTLFLAIEEPELYQHPPRARHFFRTLSTLSASPSVQVCYATHSPYFVSPDRFDAVRVFRRLPPSSPKGVVVTDARLDTVTSGLPPPNNTEARAYLTRTLSAQFCEGFFAKAVLLVEGPSDAAIFEAAADLLGMESLLFNGIVITSVGGKAAQPIALAIFGALAIPTYCVFDGDAGATDSDACETCGRVKTPRTAAARTNKKVLAALGATPVEFPETTVGEKWACFHTKIEEMISGLPQLLKAVADEMGWSGKSPEVYKEAVRRAGTEALPAEVVEILDRVRYLAGVQQGPSSQ